MRWLDTLCAWVLALLGATHLLAIWIPRLGFLRGPWMGSAAIAIISAGLMNAVRARRRSDHLLRWNTAVVTALTSGLCLKTLYQFSGNVLHQPAALATGVLTVLELFFTVAG